jgi:thiamine transport system substrate-binding protein
VPLQMFVYPVNPNAALPEAFIKYAQAPEQSAALASDVIAEKRDAWIQAWTDVVLK